MADERANSTWNDEASEADVARAAETVRGQLEERDVRLQDGDTPEELADLLSAVETFEAAVRERGGDSYTNTPRSSDPDRDEFVVPARGDDEMVPAYVRRVLAAADRLAPGIAARAEVRRRSDDAL
ncbi:MAG TPA: hypothetical protein VFS08_20370 [Gemmatimonadaceae bacterium]|nr:hypothetical protein [Gemmatimonadaceae bacterium]